MLPLPLFRACGCWQAVAQACTLHTAPARARHNRVTCERTSRGISEWMPSGPEPHRALPFPFALPFPPLPAPLAPSYLGPLSAARLTQLAIQSLELAAFGRAAPMPSKYPAQSRTDCFRSRHRAWSSSSLAGSLQLDASMSLTVNATSPMTTSITILWNIKISRDTLVASNTAAASGLVWERCHHITHHSEHSSEYASTKSRRLGQAVSSCNTVSCTSSAPMSGQRSLCRNDSSATKLDNAWPTFLRREPRVPTSHRKVRQKFAQGLEQRDRLALCRLGLHHLHNHMVDEAREHLEDGIVLVGDLVDLAAYRAATVKQDLAPLPAAGRVRLVDPHGQEELEGGLVGVLAQAAVERLLGQQLCGRGQIPLLAAEPDPQQRLRI